MGGKSSSSSSASTTTENVDMRVAADAGANVQSAFIKATGSNSRVTITALDGGAINQAFGFAREIAQDAFDLTSASQIDTAQTMTEALNTVKEAYVDAKQGEQKVLTAAALAVVAVVAVKSFGGK